MRLKWVVAAIATAFIVLVSGVVAYPYLMRWFAPDKEAAFVQACRSNKAYNYSAAECACTYHAYVKLGRSPYADLLKSSVHDAPEAFRTNLGVVVVRKISEAGLGVDPKEFWDEARISGSGAKALSATISALSKFLRKHKYKLLAKSTGFGAVAATWWSTIVVGAEVVHAKYTVDAHCGGVLATASSIPGQVWEITTDSADWTWKAVKSLPGRVGL